MGFGRRNSIVPVNMPPFQQWDALLEEQNQCVKEIGDSFQIWLDRHHKAVRESQQWKDAHDELARTLQDTQMELEHTKRRLQSLQQERQVTRSSASQSRRPKTNPPFALGNTAAALTRSERDGDGVQSQDSRQQDLVRNLQSKMESYKAVLHWQECQTEQWKSRCTQQLSQMDDLLATLEEQKKELEHETKQCDVLIDAVYQLIRQQKEDEGDSELARHEDTYELEESSPKDGRSISFPDEFFCPLTQQLFVDPVIDHEGNTYERNAIWEWLELNETSPLTRNELYKDQLVPNRAVKHAIAAFKKGC